MDLQSPNSCVLEPFRLAFFGLETWSPELSRDPSTLQGKIQKRDQKGEGGVANLSEMVPHSGVNKLG